MCKEHCSPASAPETQRIIVTMKEGLDEKQKVEFIKDFEEKGGKVVDKLDAINMLIAEIPADVLTSMQSSLQGHDVVRHVELDGEVTIQK
ncbi:hypothetical protein GGI19_004178 [Coemansia pectinata]|uniref:Inhibitor I9 domain-containing protein n=1 Tax=Coemansia pectinata TaxID=1052879 RepID=A0A9W8L9M7_9FUNG|nr:hypothetical protein GGI19_004178 [Coemansia pectinata]